MLGAITSYSTTLFRTYFIKRFMSVFLDTDIEEKKKEKAAYSFFVIIIGTVNLLFSSAFVNLVLNILLMYFIACLYEENRKKKLFVTLLIYGINAICDILAMYSLNNYIYGKDYSEITAYLTVFFIGVCEIIIEKYLIRKSRVDYLPPHWEILLFIPIVSVSLLVILVLNNISNRGVLVFVSAGLLFINLLIFYLYDVLVDAFLKLEERNLLERQADSYANQLKVMSKSEEKIRALRHDLKHHLGEILMLAESKDVGEITEYIQNMQMFMENPYEYIKSGNKDVDSLLNYLLNQAEKILNKVEYKINVPQEMNIKSFDFNIIIGNLLENAIFAASHSEKKWLFVELEFEKGILFIHIKNSYDSKPQKEGGKYISIKKDKEMHGIGLQNVKKVVDSYHGTIQMNDENKIFDVRVMLYVISNGF